MGTKELNKFLNLIRKAERKRLGLSFDEAISIARVRGKIGYFAVQHGYMSNLTAFKKGVSDLFNNKWSKNREFTLTPSDIQITKVYESDQGGHYEIIVNKKTGIKYQKNKIFNIENEKEIKASRKKAELATFYIWELPDILRTVINEGLE